MAISNNIKNLPRADKFISGDKIIIQEPAAGIKLIDFDNIYVTSDQINFLPQIESNYTEFLDLLSYSTSNLQFLSATAEELNIAQKIIHTFNTTTVSSVGDDDSSDFVEAIIASEGYSGPENHVLLTDTAVNELQTAIDLESDSIAECDSASITIGEGTFSVPRGTYRVKSCVSVTPNQKLADGSCSYEPIRSYLSLKKLTPPIRDILIGSEGYTYGGVGKSITLNLNGYFYVNQKTEFSLNLNVQGTLFPGIINSTYTNELSTFTSISDKFNKNAFRPAQIILEKISDTDSLNATEASADVGRSQRFIIPPKAPLIYNAGWLQYISNNTIVKPTDLEMTINSLPYSRFQGKVTGEYRGFITDPSAHKGLVKKGDTIKYRTQIPKKTGEITEVESNNASYDVRDQNLNELAAGWWGLLPSTSTSNVSDKFDTVVRVDKNSVIADIIYNTDPADTGCPEGGNSSSTINVGTNNTNAKKPDYKLSVSRSSITNGDSASITLTSENATEALAYIKIGEIDTGVITAIRGPSILSTIDSSSDGFVYVEVALSNGRTEIEFDVNNISGAETVFISAIDHVTGDTLAESGIYLYNVEII
jgi:hypothetical protein